MSRYHRENPDAPIKHEWFEGARQHAGVDPASGKDFSAVQLQPFDPVKQEAQVKQRLAMQTPTDIMEQTYQLVPLGAFSNMELRVIIHLLSKRLWKQQPLATENTVLNPESGLRVELLKPVPHADGDYSYFCGNDHCRCSQ